VNIESYTKAHKSLVFYDASARFGRVAARGADAIDLLHRMSTNDLLPLIGKEGTGAQTVLTNEKGRIIDLLTVLSHGNSALLLTSGGKEDEVVAWLDKFVIMEDAQFIKKSSEIVQFILFGPRALSFLSELTGKDLISLEQFHFLDLAIEGEKVILQKSHRYVESGWVLLTSSAAKEKIEQYFLSRIEAAGGGKIDDETFDLVRIEAGIPLAPNELNEKHNPLETTLVQAVSWTKGCYIGQEVIARLDTYDKVQRHLMGVVLANGDTLTAPLAVSAGDGTEIGEVTSAGFSPELGKSIGLAFIKTAFANPESSVKVGASDAKLVKLPFEV
jgi:folate-binding protein YgfZ